ncbi:hypothetical protein HGRIS_005481 [Hohenbuehelia grisea]|uniref:Uncharacterized protein n=1 Tax=Hohenbuehelia grisea TaxID=104357 RepID=A0ABR3JWX6_9AGAR
MPGSEAFSADFTSVEQQTPFCCQRDDCKIKVFEPGTPLHIIHSNDPSKPDRQVCQACYEYYLTKATTKRRPDLDGISSWQNPSAGREVQTSQKQPTLQREISTEQRGIIHKQIARSQRAEYGVHPVMAINPVAFPSAHS